LHQFHCGENEIQLSLISFASVGATLFGSANFRILPRDTGSRCVGSAFPKKQSPRCAPSTPGRPARGVAATCPAWDRVTAGSNPAALTNLKCCRGRTHEAPAF